MTGTVPGSVAAGDSLRGDFEMDIGKLKSTRAAKFHALNVLARKLNSGDEEAGDLALFEGLKQEIANLDEVWSTAN